MSEYIFEMSQVCGGRKKFKLKDISLQLEPGYIYAIAGENGAGKSTLFYTILSDKSKYTGKMKAFGMDMATDREKAMNQIAFISEDAKWILLESATANARMMGCLYDNFDENVFKEQMKKMKVSTAVAYEKLSRGEKMKFQLCFGIACGAKLFFLDEATAGMDPVFRIDFFNILRELLIHEDVSVLMTSHNMTEIEKQTDYVAIMEDGHLGEFKELV